MINTNYKPLTELINYLELKEKILKPKPMKTAMKELIDLMRSHQKRGWGCMTYDFFFAQIEEIKALEKEKEQIIDAFEVGYKSCDLDEAFEIDRKLASGEQYYNQTYNQNK